VSRAKNFEQEQSAAKLPQLRMFTEASPNSPTAQFTGKGEWVVCSPDTVGRFSATAYFFGREIHQALGVPVGLIHSSVGGTPIESWIAPETQQSAPELKAFFATQKKTARPVDPAQAKAKFEAEEGVKLSYTVFITAAVAQALKRHPYINAEIRGTNLVFKKDVHLGMAVAIDTPEPGLMVPVIKNADQKPVFEIAQESGDLAKQARDGKLKPADVQKAIKELGINPDKPNPHYA